jgi:hypothetical protein
VEDSLLHERESTKAARPRSKSLRSRFVDISKDGAIYAPFWDAITSSGRALILAPEIADKGIAVAAVRAVFEQEDVVRYVSMLRRRS